jgi:hypothetical protein
MPGPNEYYICAIEWQGPGSAPDAAVAVCVRDKIVDGNQWRLLIPLSQVATWASQLGQQAEIHVDLLVP